MSFFIGCLIEAVAVIPIPIYWTPACYKGSFQQPFSFSKGDQEKAILQKLLFWPIDNTVAISTQPE